MPGPEQSPQDGIYLIAGSGPTPAESCIRCSRSASKRKRSVDGCNSGSVSGGVYPTRHSPAPRKTMSNHTDSRHNRCFCRRV